VYPSLLLRNYKKGNNPFIADDGHFNLFKVFYVWYCQIQCHIHFAGYELNIIILLFDIFQKMYNIDMKHLIDNEYHISHVPPGDRVQGYNHQILPIHTVSTPSLYIEAAWC